MQWEPPPPHIAHLMDSESSPPAAVDARQTILVVEDESSIQLLVRAVLELQGHQVLAAGDAPGALRLSEQHAGRIDLLITDMGLPGMSGPELAEHLQAVRPELRVLYISGNPSGDLVVTGANPATAQYLPKPFTPRALIAVVRSMLAP
jgi:two-component system cell cycle sensor histidine kinase/response regulator CckA